MEMSDGLGGGGPAPCSYGLAMPNSETVVIIFLHLNKKDLSFQTKFWGEFEIISSFWPGFVTYDNYFEV
jgi:hypothetical protein